MTKQTALTDPPKKNNSTRHSRSHSSPRPRATDKTTKPTLTSAKLLPPSSNPPPPKTTELVSTHVVISQTAASSPISIKQAVLIGLMERPEGVSLIEVMKISGWQAHSVRGWISGSLRKKLGFVVTLFKSESGETCYRIQATSAAYSSSATRVVC